MHWRRNDTGILAVFLAIAGFLNGIDSTSFLTCCLETAPHLLDVIATHGLREGAAQGSRMLWLRNLPTPSGSPELFRLAHPHGGVGLNNSLRPPANDPQSGPDTGLRRGSRECFRHCRLPRHDAGEGARGHRGGSALHLHALLVITLHSVALRLCSQVLVVNAFNTIFEELLDLDFSKLGLLGLPAVQLEKGPRGFSEIVAEVRVRSAFEENVGCSRVTKFEGV
mmetsp:Transcript_66104/g.138074  ORF Transcript_66104/g.138074 Transcript_66104/m.138074 type:complete len:224 (+) Transcript_66104:384-1055(+)